MGGQPKKGSMEPPKLYTYMEEKNWKKVSARLGKKKGKREASEPMPNGDWALHFACHMGAPLKVVKDLIRAVPDATTRRSNHGALPLHEACGAGAPFEVVQLLLDFQPEYISVRMVSEVGALGTGPLPLHCALSRPGNQQDVDVVLGLLHLYPASIRMADEENRLPLHLAVIHGWPASIIKELLDSYPLGVTTMDSYGLKPTYYARRYNAVSEEGLKILMGAKKESARNMGGVKSGKEVYVNQMLEIHQEFSHIYDTFESKRRV